MAENYFDQLPNAWTEISTNPPFHHFYEMISTSQGEAGLFAKELASNSSRPTHAHFNNRFLQYALQHLQSWAGSPNRYKLVASKSSGLDDLGFGSEVNHIPDMFNGIQIRWLNWPV